MFINLDEPDLAGKPVRFVSKLMFRETGSLSIWYLFRGGVVFSQELSLV